MAAVTIISDFQGVTYELITPNIVLTEDGDYVETEDSNGVGDGLVLLENN